MLVASDDATVGLIMATITSVGVGVIDKEVNFDNVGVGVNDGLKICVGGVGEVCVKGM